MPIYSRQAFYEFSPSLLFLYCSNSVAGILIEALPLYIIETYNLY